MNQYEPNDQLALEEVAPTMVQEWKRRAATSSAWRDYSLLLHACAEALRRAPFTVEACEEIDPEAALNLELACLSDMLWLLFPDGTMREKSYEIPLPNTTEHLPTNSAQEGERS